MFHKTLESVGKKPDPRIVHILSKWFVFDCFIWFVYADIVVGSGVSTIFQSHRYHDVEKKYPYYSRYVYTKYATRIFYKSMIYDIFSPICVPVYEETKYIVEGTPYHTFFMGICPYFFYHRYHRWSTRSLSYLRTQRR